MNIFSALWITEVCLRAKLKANKKKNPNTYKKTSLSAWQGFLSQRPTCAYAITVWIRHDRALQSTWKQINSLGKSFADHSWKAKKAISVFSPLQNNHPAAFQKVEWSQKEVEPMAKLSPVTANTGDLTCHRTEGEEWRVFIQKESTNRENLPSEKAKSTISCLTSLKAKILGPYRPIQMKLVERFLSILVNFGLILNLWCFMDRLLACDLEGFSPVHFIPEIRQTVAHRPRGSWPACPVEKYR